MKAKIHITAGVLFLYLILGVLAVAEPEASKNTLSEIQRDTLKGLQGVEVLVENLKPEAGKYGLTTKQLQTDVELRLRQNGIKVLSEQERASTPGMPFLYVNVTIVAEENPGLIAYNVSLDLQQQVLLARDPTKSCSASTWRCGETGRVGVAKIETIRDTVKYNVDAFINDYLAANPKGQPIPVEEKDKRPKGN